MSKPLVELFEKELYFAHSFILWPFQLIVLGLRYKVTYNVIDTKFEPTNVTYSETFSWQGDLITRRSDENASLLYYRNKLSLQKKAGSGRWSQRDKSAKGICVIADRISIIVDYLVGSPRPPFKDPRKMYIIVVRSTAEPNFNRLVPKVLEKMWKDYGIAHAIVITPCESEVGFFGINTKKYTNFECFQVVRTYFPFKLSVGADGVPDWGEYQSFNLNNKKYGKLFTKLNNLQGFPLRVTIFRRYPTALKARELPEPFVKSYLMEDIWRSDGYGGVDGIMLSNAAKTLNFTAINVPELGSDFGYKADNGTFVGSIGSVLHSKVVASFNGRFLTDYDTNDVDYMFPHSFDRLCIIAPKALKIPQWRCIFECFSIPVWIYLLCVNSISGLFWFWLKRANIK